MEEEEEEEGTQEATALLETRVGAAAAAAVGAVQPAVRAEELEVLGTVETPTLPPPGTTGSSPEGAPWG